MAEHHVLDMTAALSDFLAAVAARPLVWGRCDCCLMVADWTKAHTGIDPAADLRAAYDDQDGAERAIKREGGLVALFARRLTAAGLRRAETPRPSDVAVVAPRGSDALFGAIVAASGYAVKTTRGLIVSRGFEPVAVWRFADG